jgi:uncharacterized membrane protein
VLGSALLVGLSVARYMGYNASMLDLGNMAQAIWSGTQGEPLVFTNRSYQGSRLSGHFELIYFLFVPFYQLWPDPRLLVGAQAILMVLGAIPAYRLALRATASVFAARCVALIYLLYPVALTAVLFDFHGDTLAMPLLLFALDALDRRAWVPYALAIVLALASKFYVALPVAGMGAVALLWGQGTQRRSGAATLVGAVAYGALVFLVLRPMFALPPGETLSVSRVTSEATGSGYLRYYFGNLDLFIATLPDRLLNGIIVLAPPMLVAWRGWRWLLPGLPVAAAMLFSTGPGAAYGYSHHHYALVVPLIVMAVVDGTRRMQQAAQTSSRRRGRSWRGDLGLSTAIVLLFSTLLVDIPLNPLFWLAPPGQGLDSSQYGITARDAMKDEFLRRVVPSREPLAASSFLGTHLANRERLYQIRYPDDPGGERLPSLLPNVAYALPDALFDWRVIIEGGIGGGAAYEQAEIAILLNDPAFDLVAARDGLLLFQRDAPAERVLPQQIERIAIDEVAVQAPLATFGEHISLAQAELTPLGSRRYRAMFSWQPAEDSPPDGAYVAVSRLEGIEHARIVHLPTYALHPTEDWQAGETVRETFEVELPPDVAPGSYTWRVGWYDLSHSEAFATDERSRLGAEVVVGTIEVER